jgi:phage gpG-like protein
MARVASGVTLDWKWIPDPVVFQDRILAVAEGLRDRTMPLIAARQYTQDDIRERFETETDPAGYPWDAWAESYKWYAEDYPNVGILRQSEELYEAATSSAAFIVSHDSVFYDSGFMPERGIWHQEGRSGRNTATGAPNPLPQRRFLGLSEEAQALIMATFGDWFDRAIDLYVTRTGRVGRRHSLRGGFPQNRGMFSPRG